MVSINMSKSKEISEAKKIKDTTKRMKQIKTIILKYDKSRRQV
jgi:hypothetical protein